MPYLLGVSNGACDCHEKHFGSEMIQFYSENHLKKSGQGPGGKFNGPSIKYILQEEVLVSLENNLLVSASSFINYLRSLRNLHQLCVAETLGDFQSVLFDFQTNFEFLYEEFNLPMTLKIHVIIDHYSDYFVWTGRTMKYTNAGQSKLIMSSLTGPRGKMCQRLTHLLLFIEPFTVFYFSVE